MSVRLGALVCLTGLAACSHQPEAEVKSPSALAPFAAVAGPPVMSPAAPEATASQAGDDSTTSANRQTDNGRDADLGQRERIRRLSMADGSL